MNDLWRWVRPSWARLYCLILAAPAIWAIWFLVLEANGNKVVILLAAGLWLFFCLADVVLVRKTCAVTRYRGIIVP
jgi:uncharacterized protein (DUF58 family)